MKTIIAILIFAPFTSYSQAWTKQYITAAGDTIKIGSIVQVNKETSKLFIDPNTPPMLKERYRIYFSGDVEGKKYRVTKISRIRGQHGWVYTAHFLYNNPAMSRTKSADFGVFIEDALASHEVEFIKQD